jgi:hypothetical protein
MLVAHIFIESYHQFTGGLLQKHVPFEGTAAMLDRTNFFLCGKLADVAALVAASQM